ncbi:hypothetical protein SNEBB_007911 [Seison nebaliae]|nr:hypothetical protein SNEBB_007911 [Seison nebaliae]
MVISHLLILLYYCLQIHQSQTALYEHHTPNYHFKLKIVEETFTEYDGCAHKCEAEHSTNNWKELIIPDLDFLYYLNTINLNNHLLLGMCKKSNGDLEWQDQYKTVTFNRGDACELWLSNEPDSAQTTQIIFKQKNIYDYCRNYNTPYHHVGLGDTVNLELELGCSKIMLKKLQAKYIISNSNQNLIRKLVIKQPTIDYKLLSGYNNYDSDNEFLVDDVASTTQPVRAKEKNPTLGKFERLQRQLLSAKIRDY